MTRRAMLGLEPDAPNNRLLVDPVLPPWLPDLTLMGLRLGQHSFDLRFWRTDGGTENEVLRGSAAAELDALRGDADSDALSFQDGLQRRRNALVLAAYQARTLLHHGHLAAEAAAQLRA